MKRRFARGIWILVLACVGLNAVVAEVGLVYVSEEPPRITGPYVLQIIEDGDPVTSAWARLSSSSSRFVLNESGAANGDGLPSASFNPISGLPVVTWGKYNGSGYDIVESHFESGAWTSPTIIVPGVTTSLDPEPSLALDLQTGAVHVVYVASDSAPQVMHVEAPANLATWTTPDIVSEIGAHALRPSAVIFQGVLVVAYEYHALGIGTTPRQITVATSDGGVGFSYETLEITHGSDPNRPKLHSAGESSLWVDWVDSANDVAWSAWHHVTGWGPTQVEPYSNDEDRDFHVRQRIERMAR